LLPFLFCKNGINAIPINSHIQTHPQKMDFGSLKTKSPLPSIKTGFSLSHLNAPRTRFSLFT
jgi:hypothetical protein